MEAKSYLKNYPSSPRKMRLLADLVRGMEVKKALNELQYNPKHSSIPLRKLLLSAIANWKQQAKTTTDKEDNLYIKSICVDNGRILKRMRPAPQGRGYKIRKRSNHVTIIVTEKHTSINIKESFSNIEKNNSHGAKN